MPAGPIEHHQDELIGMPPGHLGEEHPHRFGVHRGQYERVQYTVLRTHGGISPFVLAYDLRRNRGPHALRCPALPRFAAPSEASFVLEHQPDRTTLCGLWTDLFLQQVREFFLNSSCASASVLGCWGRGWTLRQPWRCRAR